jgi:fibro-slime domain-containing protein
VLVRFCRSAAFLALVLALAPLPVMAGGTIAATYYVLPENHPDVGHGVDGSTVPGLVEKRLGPHGWPVATNFARTKGGPESGRISDVDAAGEILWWSTTSPHGVRIDRNADEKLPLDIEAMFPSGRADDEHGFRTAHFRGSFDASSTLTGAVKLGSDDDAWVFVDGILRVDNGGVKPMSYVPYSLGRLAPGKHVIDIFYADRHGVGASLAIDTPLALAPAAAAGRSRPKPVAPARGPSLTAMQMKAQLRATGRFTLRDIHFAFNKTDITRDSAAVLGEVGKLLRDDRTLRLEIDGHTDGIGTAAYNQDLSERRAAAVKSYLVRHAGVASARLTTAGYGSSRPVASNATAKGQALNRRVEFVKR